jgi:hypothetical protein
MEEQTNIYFSVNNTHYLVETAHGIENVPKDITGLKVNDPVKIIETSYCGGFIRTKRLSRN